MRLGLRENAGQFALLVGVSALVGAMVGQERTIVPLLATDVFGITSASLGLAFIVAFGLTKAATNLAAGALADRYGRKPVLVAGWLVGLPVPFILILAPGLGLGRGRQRAARDQPGPDLVDHGPHEDRSRRTEAPWLRARPERGSRLPGGGGRGLPDRV